MRTAQANPKNDRIRREYLVYLQHARQRSPATIDQVRHAIDRLEAYTGAKDFGTFNKEQALGFKRALLGSKAERSGKSISTATAHHTLRAIREFLAWLHSQSGYRRSIDLNDVAYLNLTTNDDRVARAPRQREYGAVDQYRAALFAMPCETPQERRDQAALALILATGMRDAAVVSLKLKHIHPDRSFVFQDPHEVKTKFRKTIQTFFYPVGDDVTSIIRNWVRYLAGNELFGPVDPVFPKTKVEVDPVRGWVAVGLTRDHCANATPIREIFKTAFERVGLPYFEPHTIRHTLTQLGYSLRLDPEQLKAWSVNMGHNSVLTTLNSYGYLSVERQADIMAELRRTGGAAPRRVLVAEIAHELAAIIDAREGDQASKYSS